MDKFSFLEALHTGWVEDMYDKYLQDPQSIEEEWRQLFFKVLTLKSIYRGGCPSSFSERI